MASFKDINDVKEWVMRNTRDDLCLLAKYMGYGWTFGTKGKFPGDNMLMEGNSWIPDMSGSTDGFKADQRLKLTYGDWKIKIKTINFDKAVIENLTPQAMKSGDVINDHPTALKKTVEKEVNVVREVENNVENGFSAGMTVGTSFSYEPELGVGGGASFTLGLQSSTVTNTTTGTEKVDTFKVTSEKELKPNTAVEWVLMVYKLKASTTYVAVVNVSFSVEFQGFLRWGGADGKYTNYHQDYKGSEARPTVNCKIGTATTSFYEALKAQTTDRAKTPWLWHEITQRYDPSAQDCIARLTDPANYEFSVNGKINDIQGKQARIRWKDIAMPDSPAGVE